LGEIYYEKYSGRSLCGWIPDFARDNNNGPFLLPDCPRADCISRSGIAGNFTALGLRHIFETDPLLCRCGTPMKIVSIITDPRVVDHMLRHLASSGIITTIAGMGTYGFSGDDGIVVDNTKSFPLNQGRSDNGSRTAADRLSHLWPS
jgi:hypothetical protein